MSMMMMPIKFGLLIGRGIIMAGLVLIGYVGGAEPPGGSEWYQYPHGLCPGYKVSSQR
jgi:hypothetical protein